MLPHLDLIRIVFDVVVTIRQRQSTLPDIRNHLVRIVQVGIRIEVEQRIRSHQVQAPDLFNQRPLILDRGNPFQFRLDGRDPLRVHGLLVHARPIQVPDLLIDGIAPRPTRRGFLQNSSLNPQIAFVQFGETLP